MKKYMSVVRLGHKTTENVLQPGDPIIIQEKLDGANGSFKLEEGEQIASFDLKKIRKVIGKQLPALVKEVIETKE